ncbi:EFR1 family ferrodoxin [Clostridium sp.]|uniref:EFR1 family ferrodoxin n=1 Tax=Clostridium sp. TaxID=1506 RepID=UPI0025BB2629|nr:EFR1 family ferrodoxin [Clostridium sp.]
MKIYYFSSTGNSLYVSKKIKEALDEKVELISMTKALRDNDFVCDDDVVGFIYPIHCGSLPITALEFLHSLKLRKNSYVFAVGVSGGGEAKSSFAHINEIIKDTNILSNFLCIKYISNYIRAGRNPSEERAIEAIEKNEKILEGFINEINERKIKNAIINLD